MRRLRHHFSERRINPETGRKKRYFKTIKFFHAGEYGSADNTQRPHYHACIFGVDFPDRQLWKVRDDIRIDTSDTLDRIWGKGYTTVGDVTFASAAYVARYIMKKVNGDAEDLPDPQSGLRPYERISFETGEIYQVEKEYCLMSRRPGIGSTWFRAYADDVYPDDTVIVKGRETRPPRFYDNLFEITDPEGMVQIKEAREKKMRAHRSDNTPERLIAREKVKKAQIGMLKREL